MDDDTERFIQVFITESRELMQDMESSLLSLDLANIGEEELNSIFRAAHSIKGGAGLFGFDDVVSFTHLLEAILENLRSKTMEMNQEILDALLKSVDVVSKLIDAVEEGKVIGLEFAKEECETLERISGLEIKKEEAPSSNSKTEENKESSDHQGYIIKFIPQKCVFESGNDPLLIIISLSSLGEIKEIKADIEQITTIESYEPMDCMTSWELTLATDKSVDDIKEIFEFVEDQCKLEIVETSIDISGGGKEEKQESVSQEAKPAAQAEKKESAEVKKPAVATVRVDVDKIDRLVDIIGELVISQSMVHSQASTLPDEFGKGMLITVEQSAQQSKELQEAVMSVRMQPVKSIFLRMPRLVHDLSKKLDKEIKLETYGEETELDKTVIEQLADPLIHMLRNSVDHGIEMPDAREEAGKPRQGTVILKAYHKGGRIIIEIKDDGGGINREKVKKLAIEKGIIDAEVEISDKEIDQLIFAPGFSTADQVSDISGRGVGMDVVKRNIMSLGGVVDIESVPGQGATMYVSLPLTLAILDGMVTRTGSENYIIPIVNILEIIEQDDKSIKKLPTGESVISVRGEFIPVVYLYKILGVDPEEVNTSKFLVVLVETSDGKFGVTVDEVLGQQQVVIKSLDDNFQRVEHISGATILGDGKVSLILELADIASTIANFDANKVADTVEGGK